MIDNIEDGKINCVITTGTLLQQPFNYRLMDKIRPLWYHHLTPVNNTEELFL